MACKCWIRSRILRSNLNQSRIRKRNRNLRQTTMEKFISLCRFSRICTSLKSLHQLRLTRYRILCRQSRPKLKAMKLWSKKHWKSSIQNKLSRTSKKRRKMKMRKREQRIKRLTKNKRTANKAEELLEWKSSQSFKKLLRFYFLIFIY